MGKFGGMIAEASDAPAYFDKDSEVGATVTGRITALSVRQTRDFKTKEPETWKDGSPREQFVLILDTDLNQFDGDDGKRSIYIKWWGIWRKAFAKAVLGAAAKYGAEADPDIGDMLTVRFVGLAEETDEGMSPAKIYEYIYTPSANVASHEAAVSSSAGKSKK